MRIDRTAGVLIVEGLPVADLCVSTGGAGISEGHLSGRHIPDRHLRPVGCSAEGKLSESQGSHGKDTDRDGAHAEHPEGETADGHQTEGNCGKREQSQGDDADRDTAH